MTDFGLQHAPDRARFTSCSLHESVDTFSRQSAKMLVDLGPHQEVQDGRCADSLRHRLTHARFDLVVHGRAGFHNEEEPFRADGCQSSERVRERRRVRHDDVERLLGGVEHRS